MNSFALPRCTPEEVGIHSADILKLVKSLEQSGTEMHSIMLLRHGKVCAEGWWNPYARRTVQALQSFTKTVTGAAYGAAEMMGLLHRDEKVLDVFPEYAHLTTGDHWDELKVYHLLTMGSGMDHMYNVSLPDWMPGFFTVPIVNEPSSTLFYNSSACSMVGACIRKRSGKSLWEFLNEYVFSKIGIDGSHLKWLTHPDGQENGSGGIMMTTEDNARIVQLFLQHGEWNGEQVISREWAELAVQLQNGNMERPNDNTALGYGGMMWIRDRCFYADGAMGQFGIGFPEKDLALIVTQTIGNPEAHENVTRLVFNFDKYVTADTLPANDRDCAELQDYLSRLSLPAPQCSGISSTLPTGKKFVVKEGSVPLFAHDFCIFDDKYFEHIHALEFEQDDKNIVMHVHGDSGHHVFRTSTDGRRWYNHTRSNNIATDLSLAADWVDERTLQLDLRWVESCRARKATFSFADDWNSFRSVVQQFSVGGFDEEPFHALVVAE